MTDWEIAIAHWLPEVWQPGRKCEWRCPDQAKDAQFMMLCQCGAIDIPSREHDIPCPPPSRDLGFRLLEVIAAKGYQYNVINYFNKGKEVRCILYGRDKNFFWSPLAAGSDPDLLTAITKAAFSLAQQEEEKK